jgi:hypothetical protein
VEGRKVKVERKWKRRSKIDGDFEIDFFFENIEN